MGRIADILARHGGTALSFGIIQGAQMLAPLLALPWLGRVLGAHAFGLLMYMCVIPPVIAIFMDWGLTLGGARYAARWRASPAKIRVLLGSVFSAKMILAAFCIAASIVGLCLLPHALEWPFAYFLAVGLGITRGASPLWYYQGLAKGVARMAIFDGLAALLSLALVFIFIRQPENWQLYLLFLFACKGMAYLWLNLGLWQKYRPRPGFKAGISLLKKTRALFGGSVSSTIYTNGAQLVLGYFLPAAQMGIIVAISKIMRAVVSAINPLTQTIFPQVCVLSRNNPAKARRVLRLSLLLSFLFMLLLAACVWLLAPVLIQIALGSGYGEAVAVLRIMILAAPLMASDSALAAQVLVPFGQEKALLRVQATAAVLSLPLAALLGGLWGLTGASFLPVVVEGTMVIALLFTIGRHCEAALFK